MQKTERPVLDPITFAVIQNGLVSAARDMYTVFKRTTMLPLLYEFNDFGMNIYDDRLNMVADAPGLPVFFGSLDICIEETLKQLGGREALEPGDVLFNNHPYLTAGQPADAAVILPVFYGDRLIAFSALRAHMGDLGGKNPYPVDATDMFQEGIVFPGVKLYKRGQLDADLLTVLKANSRFPVETAGNVMAAVGALRASARKVEEIVRKYGLETYYAAVDRIIEHGETLARKAIGEIPDGTYVYEDYLDDNANGIDPEPVKLRCAVTIKGTDVTIDFTGSAEQQRGAMNCPWGYTVTSCRFALKKLTTPDLPPSGGEFRPLSVIAPIGSILNPQPPAPSYLSWSTSLRLSDMIVQALAEAVPERVPAENGGCICAVYAVITNPNTGRATVWVEDGAIGHGAVRDKDGMNALVHSIVAGTELLTAEGLETRMPIVKTRSELRQDSGGPGKFRGGLAAVAEFTLEGDGIAIVLAEKSRASEVRGLFGGMPAPDKNAFIFFPGCEREVRGGKRADIAFGPGDACVCRPAGGGGYGDPLDRDLNRLEADLLNEYVSKDAAERFYGAVFDQKSGNLDRQASEERRHALRKGAKSRRTPARGSQ